jgi:hypothetical protein
MSQQPLNPGTRSSGPQLLPAATTRERGENLVVRQMYNGGPSRENSGLELASAGHPWSLFSKLVQSILAVQVHV